MQPDERRIIILDEIPGQDESDASTSTKGRRTNRSSISRLPKGSAGRTRQQASARPVTSLICPSEPQDPGQGGHESTTSAVDTPWANSRGSNAISGGGSNANSGGQSRSASGAVDLEPPPAERTSTGVTTGFGGPAAPPVAEGSTRRTSAAYTDTRVLPLQQRVRLARREPIVILPTPERVTRTAAQQRVPGFVIGRSPSKHSGNGRPPPTEVTIPPENCCAPA
jgi:hypothetical protein